MSKHSNFTRIALAAALLLTAIPASCQVQDTASKWIWYPESAVWDARKQSRWFRHQFELPQAPTEATLWLMVDDRQTLWLNGEGPLEPEARDRAVSRYDLTGLLRAGTNLMAIEAWNGSSVAGVIARLTATMPDGREVLVTSDGTWRVSREAPEGWNAPGFDDAAWQPVQVVGSAFVAPWYGHALFPTAVFITDEELASYEQRLEGLMAPPEQFADEPPLQAQIGFVNGSAAVTLNGEARPLVMYRGIVDPMTEDGRRQVENFRDAGVHMCTVHMQIGTCWTGPQQYDFTAVDRQIRMFLQIDPEAYVIVMVRLIQPSWWTSAHPDEMVDYATPGELGGDERFRAVRGSMASQAWLEDTGAAWGALIEHVEAQPWGKRVIGYHPGYGISAEWHYFGSWREQYPDTGPAMTARFREWLRERYGTDAALQAAWASPEPTIATAEVPGVEPRKFGDLIAFHDPATERMSMDYYRCHQLVVAEALEHFGRIVKEATGGAKVCGAYYGYFFGVGPQNQGGHLELQRLFSSPYLDYFVAPYSYSKRLMGDDGRLRSLGAAHRMGGKPHILEGDIRTYLHSRDEYGRTQDVTQSLAAVTREFSTALIERAGFWYVDFGADNNGGWFDDPQIMQRAQELQSVAEQALQEPRANTAQVALVCDPDSFYAVSDGHGMTIGYHLTEDVGTEMYHTGVPFEAIHLDQLAAADLDRYRVLIFLNAVMLDPDEAALIERLREEGRHAMIFVWPPGLLTPEAVSVAQAKQVTGLDVTLLKRWLPGYVDAVTDDPLMAALPPVEVRDLDVTGEAPIAGLSDAANWYNPRDEETMERWYKAYDMEPIEGGLRWTFDTGYSYTDSHWTAPEAFEPRDGLAMDIALTGEAPTLRFTFVIKDANMSEFVAPEEVLVAGEPREHVYPLAAFTAAPWSRDKPEKPTLPLRGCKLVMHDTGDVGRCVLEATNLRALTGTLTTRREARYGSGAFAPALLPMPDQGRVIGQITGTDYPAVVATGEGRSLSVYSVAPFVPRELLAAVMQEAGVTRYIDEGGDVLRADGRFISLHTATGGRRELRLPRSVTLTDALTGAALGSGDAVTLDLEPNSTLLMEMAPIEAPNGG